MGPEPGINAHGLVGARVVLACGCVAIAPTITAAVVTLPLRCCHAVSVRLPPRHHRFASVLPLRPRCCVAVAPTCRCHGHVAGIAFAPLLQCCRCSDHCCCRGHIAIASPSRCRGCCAEAPMLGLGQSPGTNAHGLVGACVVLARGRVAVASLLLRSCRSNHRCRCGHLAVTLP